MVKDNTDSEKGNLLPLHRILFLINSMGSLICIIHIGRKTGRYVGRLYTHTHSQMDGRKDRWMDGRMDGQTDRQMRATAMQIFSNKNVYNYSFIIILFL